MRTDTGFRVIARNIEQWRLEWDQIDGVVAFKRDLYSINLICFGFARRGDTARLWCIDEDMNGFSEIAAGIERVTAGAWPSSFQWVALPAFERCWTVLHAEPDSAARSENPHLIWLAHDAGTAPGESH